MDSCDKMVSGLLLALTIGILGFFFGGTVIMRLCDGIRIYGASLGGILTFTWAVLLGLFDYVLLKWAFKERQPDGCGRCRNSCRQ
jgi:hypothetical protein